jgi:cytochrome c-type biogenesis protein CcmH
MKSLPLLLLITTLLSVSAVQATLEGFDFSGPVNEQRYKDLVGELRCLVCQNETLLASNAELAQDLRNKVYQLMAQGQTDAQIIDFLVARYGNFVLYNPPVTPSTFILWFGPFVLLLIAALFLYRSIRRRAREAEAELTEEEQQRIEQVLGQTSPPQEKH